MTTGSTATPSAASASAMAVPETIDTSCSADGPPNRTTTGGQLRAAAPPAPVYHGQPSQSPRNSISYASVDAVALGDRRRGRGRRAGATSAAWPFWSLTMKLACFSRDHRAADPRALQPGLVDEPAGRVVRRVAEDAAGRRQAERLVRLAPAPDVVEPGLDRVRVGRGQPERGLEDELRLARPPAGA